MDINPITSKLNDADILSLTNIIESNSSEFNYDDFINEVQDLTKNLEANYNKTNDVFPDHDFTHIAFKMALKEYQTESISSDVSKNANRTETETVVANNVADTTTSIEKPDKTEDSTTSNVVSGKVSNDIPSAANLSTKYDSIVNTMSEKYNVPTNLIKRVINTESSFNPDATSKSGAMGLMQLMPATAKWLGVNNAYNPTDNIEGGTKYLSQLLEKYAGNTTLAVAAYNAGPGNVDKYKGIPPFTETQNYVRKILG